MQAHLADVLEEFDSPLAVSIDDTGCSPADVCARADQEEEDEEEGLEVEQRGLVSACQCDDARDSP